MLWTLIGRWAGFLLTTTNSTIIFVFFSFLFDKFNRLSKNSASDCICHKRSVFRDFMQLHVKPDYIQCSQLFK